MKKYNFDISIEEFDAPFEEHEFSENYKREKERNLRAFKKEQRAKQSRLTKILAAAAALLIASPLVINAASDGDYFRRIWGTLGRHNIDSHVEHLEEKGKDLPIIYPQREYVDVDVEQADALIGDAVEQLHITKEVDGTTITITSIVRDRQAAVIELTLEKEGGVDILNYSQLDNESKGAWFSDASTFIFDIGTPSSSGLLYVDLERSTDEKLYCTYFARANGLINLYITKYPCTVGERTQYSLNNDAEAIAEIEENTEYSTTLIKSEKMIDYVEFVNPEGGILNISPLSMWFYENVGLGLDDALAHDPYSIYRVCINYKDGSTYLVEEHNNSFYEDCEVEVANYNYACGGLHDEQYYLFNRLVDVDLISSIEVNDVEFLRVE